MLVYSQYLTSRIEYIVSTLLTAAGIARFSFTTNENDIKNTPGPILNYSPHPITDKEVWIQPVSLLLEAQIKEQQIHCFDDADGKAFFKTPDGDLPFDVFAAAFYLISRYEEYLPHKKDVYGRYAHENSLAYKEKFLHLPLVNLWLQRFTRLLKQKFPSLALYPKSFAFLPTYDIDIAYSYLHKGVIRNIGGFIKSAWYSEWALVTERMSVLFGQQIDPFDSYAWLDELHDKKGLKPIYFFLLASKNKDYDKNILPGRQAMKKLIQQHAQKYQVAVHPSWQSGDNKELLRHEIKVLEEITGTAVTKSRQHYIRLHLPYTYRGLSELGIKEDYTMGYGSVNGFRASYALPFQWYDLEKETVTGLTIFPFCYMDANSFYEQHGSVEKALEEMEDYYQVIKKVNGLFITVWHNHFLGTYKMFKGWRDVYCKMIESVDQNI